MVDNAARSKLRETVDDYFTDKIAAHTFDERLMEISDNTADQTVKDVIINLWFIYDDIVDHKVNINKEVWDSIQRMMLAVESGAEFIVDIKTRWVVHPSQGVALLTLLVTGTTLYFLANILVLIVPGAIAIWLYFVRERVVVNSMRTDSLQTWPFGSFSEIRTALRRSPSFRKRRYRSEVGMRHIRSNTEETALMVVWIPLMCLFSPLILLWQCLPLKVSEYPVIRFSETPVSSAVRPTNNSQG